MRTVLHLMNFIGSGGAERYIISLVRGLKDRGCKFYVGVSKRTYNTFEKELEEVGAKIVLLQIKSVVHVRAIANIIRFCKENNVDVIHTHFLRENCVSVLSKILGNKVLVINTCHMNWKNRLSVRLLNRVVTKFNDTIIAVSKAVKKSLVAEGINRDKIEVIYNGVDTKYWGEDVESTIDSEFKITEGVFKIVTVARFNEEKGYFYLLDIIKEVLKKVDAREVKFLLVGDGEQKNEVVRCASENNIDDAIIFTGARNDIRNILRGANLYISPSKSEALGISILEAMASGVLVVATNVGGTAEILGRDSEFLIEYGDVSSAANKILKIYKDYGNITQEALKKGKDRIRDSFSIEDMIRRTYNLYNFREDVK